MSRKNSSQSKVALAMVAMAVAAAPACARKAENAKSDTEPANARDAHVKPARASIDAGLKEHMQEHYEAIRAIERALVVGDLETAKEEARYLHQHGMRVEVPGHEPEARAVEQAAREFAETATPESAPRAAAALATSCGHCHLVTTAITSFESVPVPEDGADAKSRMQRHLWAMDRLWEGLVGPSDSLWEAGASVLSSKPFPVSLVESRLGKDEAAVFVRVFEAAARTARSARSESERAEVYGSLLGTCAACHARARDGAP